MKSINRAGGERRHQSTASKKSMLKQQQQSIRTNGDDSDYLEFHFSHCVLGERDVRSWVKQLNNNNSNHKSAEVDHQDQKRRTASDSANHDDNKNNKNNNSSKKDDSSKRQRQQQIHISFHQACFDSPKAIQAWNKAISKLSAQYVISSYNFCGGMDLFTIQSLLQASRSSDKDGKEDDYHHHQLLNLSLSLPTSFSGGDESAADDAKNTNALRLLEPLLQPCTRLQQLKLDWNWNNGFCAEPDQTTENKTTTMNVLQHVVTALLSLPPCLTRLEWTRCKFLETDAHLGILIGGILALKEQLEHIRIQASGRLWTCAQALPLLSHLLTDLPQLNSLQLDLKDCPTLLRRQQQQGDNVVDDSNDPQKTAFCQALATCHCQSVRLAWCHAGWSETFVLKLLAAVAFPTTTTCQFSLHLRDQEWIQTESFVDQLIEHLPRFALIRDLTLVNSSGETTPKNHQTWWSQEKQNAVIEALYRNSSLHTFDLVLSATQQVDFSSVFDPIMDRLRSKIPASSSVVVRHQQEQGSSSRHQEATKTTSPRNHNHRQHPRKRHSWSRIGKKKAAKDEAQQEQPPPPVLLVDCANATPPPLPPTAKRRSRNKYKQLCLTHEYGPSVEDDEEQGKDGEDGYVIDYSLVV